MLIDDISALLKKKANFVDAFNIFIYKDLMLACLSLGVERPVHRAHGRALYHNVTDSILKNVMEMQNHTLELR